MKAESDLQVRLMFGAARPDGSVVTQAEWRDFVDHEVTPRFPSGFTVFAADGQWQSPDGAITREASRILWIVTAPEHGLQERDLADRLRAVAAAYRARFRQEAVGVAIQPGCATFR